METCGSSINNYAVPLLAYSFGIIDMDKKGIQRKTSYLPVLDFIIQKWQLEGLLSQKLTEAGGWYQ
jgi:hypothetical protein